MMILIRIKQHGLHVGRQVDLLISMKFIESQEFKGYNVDEDRRLHSKIKGLGCILIKSVIDDPVNVN